jgi:RNA polymerase sigma-70 factor, ECF subfamily
MTRAVHGNSRVVCYSGPGNKRALRVVSSWKESRLDRESRVQDESPDARFERMVLPHLDAAYNLARWMLRNQADAEDLVQEALLHAFRAFHGLRGADGRAWLLAIVRNSCYTWLRRNRSHEAVTDFDEEVHTPDGQVLNPERIALQAADGARVRQALENLPAEFREVLVLREIEGLSYKEIGTVADIPIGTVMSRLARARDRLHRLLSGAAGEVA